MPAAFVGRDEYPAAWVLDGGQAVAVQRGKGGVLLILVLAGYEVAEARHIARWRVRRLSWKRASENRRRCRTLVAKALNLPRPLAPARPEAAFSLCHRRGQNDGRDMQSSGVGYVPGGITSQNLGRDVPPPGPLPPTGPVFKVYQNRGVLKVK